MAQPISWLCQGLVLPSKACDSLSNMLATRQKLLPARSFSVNTDDVAHALFSTLRYTSSTCPAAPQSCDNCQLCLKALRTLLLLTVL
jgi:hypothetical protein